MASTIKLKNSTTTGNAPSSLETGEVAINVTDGNLFYGSASAVKQHFIVDELEVKGNLTAQQYIVSSSITYTTQSFSSGSTAFGDSADDTHVFTGAITASGNISASDTLYAQFLRIPQGIGAQTNGAIYFGSAPDGDNGYIYDDSENLILGYNDNEILKIHDVTPIIDITGDLKISSHITASGNISASGTITANAFTGNGLSINGSSNAHIEVGEYPVGYDTLGLNTLYITGSGLIVSGAMADTNHHNMLKIGDVELLDVNTAVTKNQFLIHNVKSFAITSGSDVGSIVAGTFNTLFLHNGNEFFLCKGGEAIADATIKSTGTTTTIQDTNITLDSDNGVFFRAPNVTSGITHFQVYSADPNTTPQQGESLATSNVADIIGVVKNSSTSSFAVTSSNVLFGNITASGNVSSSGTITGNSIVGTLGTAAQTNITSLGTLTALTVDELNLNGNSISSTTDSDVYLTISTNGFGFEANAGDKFVYNAQQNNVDLQYSSENDQNIFYIDASADKVGIGDATPTAKLDVAGDINTTSHITASGNISASGTITGNSIIGTVGTATQGTIDHDSLANFVANEHIDHSGVSITAGAGLTGGGTIASTRDIAVGAGTGVTVNANDVAIGQDVATTAGVLFASITASGDISASGTITADGLTVAGNILHSGDTDTKIAFGTDTVSIKAGNTTVFSSTVTGSKVENVHQNIYDTGSVALNTDSALGDIVKFGGTSTTAGKVYFLKGDGTWGEAQANAASTATGSLAVAVGSNSTTNGMCLRGFIHPETDPGAGIGSPVFLSDAASGRILGTAPDSTNDVVRIVGYQYGTDLIYFNPSNDFIVHE